MAKIKIEEVDKIFGDDIISPSAKSTKVSTYYDIGNYALNYVMSKNLKAGVPAGRVTGLEGLGSTGKSLLALSTLKDPKIDLAILIETEGGGSSEELMEFANVDLSKVRILKAHTFASYKISKKTGKREEVPDKDLPKNKNTAEYFYVEGATSLVKKLMDTLTLSDSLKGKNIVIILDSIANMQSVRELGGTQDMGARAKDISTFFRNFDNLLEKTNVAFIYTNKLYQNLGNIYDPYVAAGGENVFYNSSLIVRLSTTAESHDISEAEKKEDRENRNTSLGSQFSTLKGFVRKSRFGTRFRTAQFVIDSQLGVTRYSGLFKLLRDFGVMPNSGSWYSLPDLWGDKRFYKKDFIDLLREDEEGNIDKLQKILTEREKAIKIEKENQMSSGVVDNEVSEDLYEDPDEIDDMIPDEGDMINSVIRDSGL
jgi:RecA/RadA recombinase